MVWTLICESCRQGEERWPLDRLAEILETMDREIVISRVLNAPRELVWEAWTDPKHVVHWWGPNGFTTTIETMDVRPGGVWKHVMHGPDGTDYPNKSVFIEVVKPERIVYSHGGGREGGPGVHFGATWTFHALEANSRGHEDEETCSGRGGCRRRPAGLDDRGVSRCAHAEAPVKRGRAFSKSRPTGCRLSAPRTTKLEPSVGIAMV